MFVLPALPYSSLGLLESFQGEMGEAAEGQDLMANIQKIKAQLDRLEKRNNLSRKKTQGRDQHMEKEDLEMH